MSLSTAYEKVDRNSSSCITCKWYAELSPSDKDFFDSKIGNGQSTRKLWRACVANGFEVAESSFRNHVRDHHKAEL